MRRGFTSNIILLMFYAAPLGSLVEVVQTRCSGLLVWQLSLMSILNGLLWVLYGLVSLPYKSLKVRKLQNSASVGGFIWWHI